MDADLKKILKAVVLEMRHELEGYYDIAGKWHPGDLETRLAEIGVRKDRASVPVDELGRLIDEDVRARKIVDAFIDVREQAGVDRAEAVAEYIRESAYTWANRLVALRCMEARELLDDEIIVGREAYGGRSLVHHRLAQSSPELCTGEDDGRFAMLAQVFAERSKTLPMLFDPDSASIALRPSSAALKNCLAWLSGTQKARSQEPATDAVFAAPDALGWAYQYWNTEEKDRVFETVRTKKGAKIEGADIIPATQLYTEDYMVKFLVQNSLGATWMGMHPESKLFEGWEYYVRDADRALVKTKPLQQITLLDPACGSGHFLLEAFDMFYTMYEEEGLLKDPEAICRSILENNLFGIDIDERSIQIAEASLWMKAEEKSFGFCGANTNLVSATSSHLKGESWERYLAKLKNEPSTVRVLRRFAMEMEHIDELGSLARPAEALASIINEEHAIWEKQERERREADKSLFQEIRDDILASQLPFQDISDKEFFERTMRHALFAIDGFTAEARESGEFNDQLMGAEAKTGFRLLELLSRKYAVVVANPPYMGSKNMGQVLKTHVERHFTTGKRDLYAAFMVRNAELSIAAGRIAMVTQQSWMFLKSFSDLRSIAPDAKETGRTINNSGLLHDSTIETLVHLGEHAFDDSSAAGAFVAMFTFATVPPEEAHRIYAYRLVGPKSATEKQALLLTALEKSNSILSKPLQNRFLGIPKTPICYWVKERFFEILENEQRVEAIADVRDGLTTGNNLRFLRFRWETGLNGPWRNYAKSGRYCKWVGLDNTVVNWNPNGTRIKQLPSSYVRNERHYFTSGLTYNLMARGSLGVRYLRDAAFDPTSISIFAKSGESIASLASILNSRISSYLLRLVALGVKFNGGYVSRHPIPSDTPSLLADYEATCIGLKSMLVSNDPIESTFHPRVYANIVNRQHVTDLLMRELSIATLLHTVEGLSEEAVFAAYHVANDDVNIVLDETGKPAGWYPLVETFCELQVLNSFNLIDSVEKKIRQIKPVTFNNSSIQASRDFVMRLFQDTALDQADENDAPELAEDDEDSDKDSIGGAIHIPAETLIEFISQHAELHPITVFWFIKDGGCGLDWRSLKNERRIVQAVVLVKVSQLLGHRWPAEAEGDQLTDVAVDQDGIIPLTDVANESTLQERIIASLLEFQADTPYFADVLGKPITDWLPTEFFGHHVKQFKKRPIFWQLQSSGFTTRKLPAFACLIYFGRVDVDTIAKIRTQYTGPLKVRFETELRGISSTPTASRSNSQAQRAVELEEAITELHTVDEKLAAIGKSGFGPDNLQPTLRQYAFDDAMLSMKACWLQRLSVLLKQSPGEEAGNGVRNPSPFDDWQDQAIKIELHQDLAAWIGKALSHLSYFCSQVGPKAPGAKQTLEDPTAADFGSLIQAEITPMQTDAMKLACGVWWGKFDAAVLAPIRERIKILKAEQKELNAAIKEDRQPVLIAEEIYEESEEDDGGEIESSVTDMPLLRNHVFEQTTELTKAAMTARLKEVKAKIKKFTEEMDSKAGKAQAIRDAIQGWRLPDPLPASLDFSPSSPNLSPLFDQVSSLDERRSPPKTIAEFIAQESLYAPDINDGVRVNIAPLQKAGVLAADVLAPKDVDKAIADRAEWRADERRWVREGKLPQPGWWKVGKDDDGGMTVEETDGSSAPTDGVACKQFVSDGKEDK